MNAALAAAAILLGSAAVRLAGDGGGSARAGGVTRAEVTLTGGAVVVNAAVTTAGWWLWRGGHLTFAARRGPGTAVELVGLILLMDLLGYLMHTVSHVRPFYSLVHRIQHRFTDPRPMTLFAMHPVEVAGIGVLWIVVLTGWTVSVWTVSVWTLAAYVVLNIGFGTLAHLGVEPVPVRLRRSLLFRWIALPTFHAGHHRNPEVNRGFYTTTWDRLFHTIDPTYDRRRTAPPPYPQPETV
ncbi:sterol desaturase family protein [Frankia sp. Cas3]|uniref:sterol desaturase family protein n=1 Tax=Frankia sp. Cas3 TaxID=3073926 RepID=UPI002AD26CAE|nr:sterol desaturase family protein [Frankia sp. Cas3]